MPLEDSEWARSVVDKSLARVDRRAYGAQLVGTVSSLLCAVASLALGAPGWGVFVVTYLGGVSAGMLFARWRARRDA